MMFSGSIVALITPFHNGEVDVESLKKLVEWHINAGTHGIVACGSTGEGLLLSPAEWHLVLKCVIETANKRVPIIAGCSVPSTIEAIKLVQEAQNLGADGALVVTPPYVKPSQEGVYHHFHAIHENTELPLIIYNNPGRVVIDLSVDLIARLSDLPRVVALKDSNGDMTRITQLRAMITKPFAFLSGDDPTAGAYLALGGHGFISVTANAIPHVMVEFVQSWQNQHLEKFTQLNDDLMAIHLALGAETNPTPLKYALSTMGLCHNELRLPLLPVSKKTQGMIDQALSQPQFKRAA